MPRCRDSRITRRLRISSTFQAIRAMLLPAGDYPQRRLLRRIPFPASFWISEIRNRLRAPVSILVCVIFYLYFFNRSITHVF